MRIASTRSQPLLLARHEGDEIPFLGGRASPSQHLVAFAREPAFDPVGIAEPLRRQRYRHRVEAAPGRRAALAARRGAVAGGAGRRVAALRMPRQVKAAATLGGEAGEAGILPLGLV